MIRRDPIFYGRTGKSYTWTAYALDGCTNIYTYPRTRGFRAIASGLAQAQIPPALLAKQFKEQQTGSLVEARKQQGVVAPRAKFRIV